MSPNQANPGEPSISDLRCSSAETAGERLDKYSKMQAGPLTGGMAGRHAAERLQCRQKSPPHRVVCRAATSSIPFSEGGARKIAIFVEPSPFSHVSGMKIRFSNLIKGLRDIGDDVTVVTPCINPPKTFCGAKVMPVSLLLTTKQIASAVFVGLLLGVVWTAQRGAGMRQQPHVQVINVLGFSLPFYRSPTLLLSMGLSVRVLWHLLWHRPDVIHVSSPGLLVFATILYAKLLAIPLVVSYHTHIPEYIPRYTWRGLVEPMWKLIRFSTLMADLTLVPSKAMKVCRKCRQCWLEKHGPLFPGVGTSWLCVCLKNA